MSTHNVQSENLKCFTDYCHLGKSFKNKETFGQFPLQVDGVKDLHESLEVATAQGEIETVNQDAATKSGQEVITPGPILSGASAGQHPFLQHVTSKF